MSVTQIPLFPLHTVLFPGGALPLRIFEARYIDMVRACLRDDSGFGICLISSGREVGGGAEVYEVGTLARVGYFQQLDNGMLGITARGEQRFRILRSWVTPAGLLMAEVELLAAEAPAPITEELQPLAQLLREVIEQLGPPYTVLPADYADAAWVSQRLTELLPLENELKQHFLLLDSAGERLQRIQALLAKPD